MTTTSENILAVATEYLGPAAITLLERQTRFHMNGLAFQDIGAAQCEELAKWVGIASAMFIEQDQAAELAEKIRKMGL